MSKEYSVLSQAWKMVELEKGTIDKWGLEKTDTGVNDEYGNRIYNHSAQSTISEALRKHLNVSKVCETGQICYDKPSYNLAGTKMRDAQMAGTGDSPADASFYLSDGTYINLGWYNTSEERIDVSVTLPKGGMVLGKTRFFFYIDKNGLLPEGSIKRINEWNNNCNPNTNGTSVTNGRGCTAWVIYNKNLDYLHCRNELSWNGKTKCD